MKKTKYKQKKAGTLGLVHLGCPKNQVDSEEILAVFADEGWQISGDPDNAEVLILNTCAFIDAAREESRQAISDAIQRKKDGRCSKVLVTGCLAQRYPETIASEFPDVDGVIGLGHTAELPLYLDKAFKGERPVISTPPPPEWQEIGARVLSTPSWTTYLRIGEGCDHTCSFCAIPSFRGSWRSRPAHLLVQELEQLTALGLKEAILVGQDTTLYGRETLGQWSLTRLVRELGKMEGLRWQRIMYAHPGRVDSELIDLFGEVENLARYIDMPFQHGDDGMLKRMKRAGTTARYLDIVRQLREVCPQIAVRTTFLVGFPGETEEEFENLCSFVREVEADHAGVFVYSHEEQTSAFLLENSVPRELAEERRSIVMEIQADISRRRLELLRGSEIEVLVEGRISDGRWLARSERDAPEIDGCVLIKGGSYRPGTMVRVVVDSTDTHDIFALPVKDSRKADTAAQQA